MTPSAAATAAPAGRPWVLHVIDSLGQGGAEQLLVTLADHLDEAGVRMQVASLRGIDETSPVVRALRARRVRLHTLAAGHRFDPRAVVRLATLARRQDAAVIHGHLPYGMTVAALAGWLARRPVMVTVHGPRDVHGGHSTLKRRITAAALRHGVHQVVAATPELARRAHIVWRVPTGRIVILANAVDTRCFSPGGDAAGAAIRTALLAGRDGPLIVAVGSLLPVKGHDTLVTALPRLVATRPGLRVAIVGRPGSQHQPLRRQIEALGLAAHVTLTGVRDDVADVLAAADLFVLPSRREGLPLALLEAMAAGVPVVAAAVGSVPDVVADGRTGVLVATDDPDALAAGIARLLDHPQDAARMAAAGRATVLAEHGATGWARQLHLIYRQVVAP